MSAAYIAACAGGATGAGTKAAAAGATRPMKAAVIGARTLASRSTLGLRGVTAVARVGTPGSVERAFAAHRARGRGVRMALAVPRPAADARHAAGIVAVLGLLKRVPTVAMAIPDAAVDPRIDPRHVTAALGRAATPRLSRVTVPVSEACIRHG